MSTGVSSGSPYPTNIYILAKRLNSCEARNLRHFTYQRNVLAWLSQAFCWYNSLYLLVKVRKKIIANRCSLVNENYEWWAFISDTSNREFPPDFLNCCCLVRHHRGMDRAFIIYAEGYGCSYDEALIFAKTGK
jgi:hypothetical protein